MAKKYAVKNNSTIMAKKAHNKLDYYLRTPAGEDLYLFTREYANVKHFFTLLGKMFFTPYGKEFFTYLSKQIFTS